MCTDPTLTRLQVDVPCRCPHGPEVSTYLTYPPLLLLAKEPGRPKGEVVFICLNINDQGQLSVYLCEQAWDCCLPTRLNSQGEVRSLE